MNWVAFDVCRARYGGFDLEQGAFRTGTLGRVKKELQCKSIYSFLTNIKRRIPDLSYLALL